MKGNLGLGDLEGRLLLECVNLIIATRQIYEGCLMIQSNILTVACSSYLSVDLSVEIMINNHITDSTFDFLISRRFRSHRLTNAVLISIDPTQTAKNVEGTQSNPHLN